MYRPVRHIKIARRIGIRCLRIDYRPRRVLNRNCLWAICCRQCCVVVPSNARFQYKFDLCAINCQGRILYIGVDIIRRIINNLIALYPYFIAILNCGLDYYPVRIIVSQIIRETHCVARYPFEHFRGFDKRDVPIVLNRPRKGALRAFCVLYKHILDCCVNRQPYKRVGLDCLLSRASCNLNRAAVQCFI